MTVESRILERLEAWQQEEGSLPETLHLYRDLLKIQVEAGEHVPVPQPAFTRAEIAIEIRKGVPVLKWDALSIAWPEFANLLGSALNVIGLHSEQSTESVNDLVSDIACVQEAAETWYRGSSLLTLADRFSISEGLLDAAVHCAIKPTLTAQAEALIDSIPLKQWRRRYCPICGGKPDFAYLEKEAGARWLLCSRCDTAWLFQRVECPYCGNEDQEKLKYFPDDTGLYRLYVCDRCQSYVKAIDLRQTESETLLPLERVLTLDLDRQAQEMGYHAGWTASLPRENQ